MSAYMCVCLCIFVCVSVSMCVCVCAHVCACVPLCVCLSVSNPKTSQDLHEYRDMKTSNNALVLLDFETHKNGII